MQALLIASNWCLIEGQQADLYSSKRVVQPTRSSDSRRYTAVNPVQGGRAVTATVHQLHAMSISCMLSQNPGGSSGLRARFQVSDVTMFHMRASWMVMCRQLYKQRPTSSLLGVQTIVSVVGIWVLDVCFLLAGFEYMRHQPGYVLWPAQ